MRINVIRHALEGHLDCCALGCKRVFTSIKVEANLECVVLSHDLGEIDEGLNHLTRGGDFDAILWYLAQTIVARKTWTALIEAVGSSSIDLPSPLTRDTIIVAVATTKRTFTVSIAIGRRTHTSRILRPAWGTADAIRAVTCEITIVFRGLITLTTISCAHSMPVAIHGAATTSITVPPAGANGARSTFHLPMTVDVIRKATAPICSTCAVPAAQTIRALASYTS